MLKKLKKLQCLNNNAIKIIAAFSMLIDHVTKAIIIPYLILHSDKINNIFKIDFINFGKMALPLFAFLLTEGFFHTKNIKKYISTIFLFAIISEPIFDLTFFQFKAKTLQTYPFYFYAQNILFTLGLSLIMMQTLKTIKDKFANELIKVILNTFIIIFFAILTILLELDYSCWCIFFVANFYFFKNHRLAQTIGFLITYFLYTPTLTNPFIYLTSIIILMYNNKKGTLNLKNFFYIFYPAHLLILYTTAHFFIYN